MKKKLKLVLLFCFVLTLMLPWIIDFGSYASDWSFSARFFLGIVGLFLALGIIVAGHFSWRKVIFVVLAYIFGHWWFILSCVVFIIWSINGFAP
ncbi:hypothetical protein ACO0LM_23290 [Undibacterium sp. Di26W]|uniref:hypothetical protein n=1 Tax=Undibacterium sp. Di26W TaxID=3413035 RepID=UPI003BF2C88A